MKIRFLAILAILAGLISPAYSAGTIPLSLSQQFDSLGHPLAGCKLYFFQAGTSTPQIAYQDSALTIPVPGGSQMTCDSAGRLGQFFLADGSVKIRLADKNGVTQIAADGILVVGASSGGGGGSPVDATTILATGDLKVKYGTGTLSGFVRANGRTIGSATSGATERANSDCQTLFEYLWNADSNLTVSTGRGASANADWVANKTIVLPDWRGRAIAGLDDMGNSSAARLASVLSSTTLGAAGGSQTQTIAQANLPNVNFAVTDPGHTHTSGPVTDSIFFGSFTACCNGVSGGSFQAWSNSAAMSSISTGSSTTGISVNSGGSGTALAVIQPSMLATIYIKL